MIPFLDSAMKGSEIDFDVTVTHPVYNAMIGEWEKCRDVFTGEEAVKDRGTRYLPQLNGQTANEYKKYLMRSQFYGATGRTVEAYMGMLFRKDPLVVMKAAGQEQNDKTDDERDKFFKVITNDGKSSNEVIKMLTEEVIVMNKVGVLIDHPTVLDDDGNPIQLTVAQAEARNIRPMLSIYNAESIVNWYWDVIDNKVVPVMFVLKEERDYFPDNSLTNEQINTYRILYLEGYESGAPKYKQIVVTPSQEKGKRDKHGPTYVVESVTYPLKNGKYIEHLPFYTVTDMGIDYRRNAPSMINDLANANLGHFRNSADWENELHWVGIKTAYFPGWNKKTYGNPKLGGALAGPRDSIPTMIESTSDSGIKDEMKLKEERMSVLGAERISQKGRYIPSAETAKINSSSEGSVLAQVSKSMSSSLSIVYEFLLDWAGMDYDISVRVNTDFYQDDISGEELLKWVEGYQGGGYSFEMMYFNLNKKEAYPPKWSMEKELARINESSAGWEGVGDVRLNAIMDEIDEIKLVLGDRQTESESKEESVEPQEE